MRVAFVHASLRLRLVLRREAVPVDAAPALQALDGDRDGRRLRQREASPSARAARVRLQLRRRDLQRRDDAARSCRGGSAAGRRPARRRRRNREAERAARGEDRCAGRAASHRDATRATARGEPDARRATLRRSARGRHRPAGALAPRPARLAGALPDRAVPQRAADRRARRLGRRRTCRAGRCTTSRASSSLLGLVVWAALELVSGANWLRRLLGAGFLVYLAVRRGCARWRRLRAMTQTPALTGSSVAGSTAPTALFNPRTFDASGFDEETRRVLLATIEWFEAARQGRAEAAPTTSAPGTPTSSSSSRASGSSRRC